MVAIDYCNYITIDKSVAGMDYFPHNTGPKRLNV
jgi:hypothetical protein